MASHWFSDKEITCLISSLQNLWSSALIIQHRLLSNILKRRTDRHRVLKLILCDKVISREKKKCERKKQEYWIGPRCTKQWWFQFLNNEVVADLFLSYVKNLASTSARKQQDFENIFLWRCKLLLQYIIFLTKDDLEKLRMHLELLRIQCHSSSVQEKSTSAFLLHVIIFYNMCSMSL